MLPAAAAYGSDLPPSRCAANMGLALPPLP